MKPRVSASKIKASVSNLRSAGMTVSLNDQNKIVRAMRMREQFNALSRRFNPAPRLVKPS